VRPRHDVSRNLDSASHLRANSHGVSQVPPAEIIEASLQSIVLEPIFEGLMSRLRRPYLPKELDLQQNM
jgi:hypothetical protein